MNSRRVFTVSVCTAIFFFALITSQLASAGIECNQDADCDDGVYCNGEEVCVTNQEFPKECCVGYPAAPGCVECTDESITQLTLLNTGPTGYVRVYEGKKPKPPKIIFEDWVSGGGTFTFTGSGPGGAMTQQISIWVGNNRKCLVKTIIHASCYNLVGPGLVRGDFVVVEAHIPPGVLCPICPLPCPPPLPCDEGSDSCSAVCANGETRTCSGSNVGECQKGTETCVYGNWSGVCDGEIEPAAEVCDGLDNDCNGLADDGDFGTTTCGEGECEHTINNCEGGALQTCDPMEGSGPEICEGSADEDCDGVIDDGCVCTNGETRACGTNMGECQEGTETCENGSWSGVCDGEIEPAAEVCDGLDNDCNGLADDGDFGTTTCGEGECEHTINNCEGGALQTCDPMEGSGPEICEGSADEDCDGVIDDGCVCTNGETRACGTNMGECQEGTETCENGSWSGVCDGEIEPAAEVCDGLDNDCNGLADDGDFGTTTCGEGECEHTINNCEGGALQTCDPMEGSGPEICEGSADEDCDGVIDDGCVCTNGETRACGTNMGECQEGTETCENGSWSGVCDGEIEPAAEVCDGLDNDCNGLADDGDFGTTTCGEGECEHTINNCEGGALQTCDPMEGSGPEICEGSADEDCDGVIDDGCVCTNGETRACGTNMGECQEGTETCENGSWSGVCDGEIPPAAEVCDGLDNDCNGLADDGDFGTTTCGEGECEHTINNCEGGALQTCDPMEGSGPEICEGSADEDCDGVIDDGCVCTNGETRACGTNMGECQEGTETCENGSWSGVCDGEIPPAAEVCDGLDNNCNGLADDGDFGTTTCGEGECEHTINNCEGGVVQTCDPMEGSGPEICEGSADEDCDGVIDDGCVCTNGETRACGTNMGECQEGTETCENGSWSGVCDGEIEPAAEVCDGLDNDCNGLADDGDFGTTTCGEGECEHTINNCEGGALQTCDPMEGSGPEICEGSADEDCDGVIDDGCVCTNGETRACGTNMGECQEGTETCENGSWSGVCDGEIEPAAEVCDGLDNDCNGLADDGDFGTTTCGEGECEHTINNCEGGALQTCDPMEGSGPEICEGSADEDCDGVIDDGCVCPNGETRACGTNVGECQEGTETCENGSWSGVCDEEIPPAAEVCDGLDNDCNGLADDGDFGTTTCGEGECEHTINNCEGGALQTCDPMEGSAEEVCEGSLDEDCDGAIDNGCDSTTTTIPITTTTTTVPADTDVLFQQSSVYYNPNEAGGETVKRKVCLDNPYDLVGGIQFDECEYNVNNDPVDCMECINCELTERTTMFDCMVLELPNGCCRVLLFCKNPGCAINPGLCDIVTIVYKSFPLSDECPGTYCGVQIPENIVVSDYDGYQLTASALPAQICPVVCGDVCPPDSDPLDNLWDCGDGVVDIYDIMCEVDLALTTLADTCQLERADVPTGTPPWCSEPDGSVNILDIMVLIDMSLNRQDCCSFYYQGIIY